MRVLMLAPWWSIHSKRTLGWLLKSGCHVTFVDSQDVYPEPNERYEFKPYPVPRGGRYYWRLGPRISNRLATCTILWQLRRLWRRVRPDLVHLHWVDGRAYHCVKAGLRPLVLSVWGSDINQHFWPDADPQHRRLAGKALAGADLVIADAPDMAEKCALLAGRKISTEILTIGIPTQKFRPGYVAAAREWREKLGVAPDAIVLISIRGMDEYYGHHIILEAFSRALPRLRSSSVLVFKSFNREFSADRQRYEMELRRRAEELGIGTRVRWIEEVSYEKMPEVYALADIIINYPRTDGFPVSFLEAASCERPVISVRLPSYLGTFAEKYFRMVEPWQLTDLSDAIIEKVNELPGQRVKLLAEARQVIIQEHDETITTQRLLGFYKKLAN